MRRSIPRLPGGRNLLRADIVTIMDSCRTGIAVEGEITLDVMPLKYIDHVRFIVGNARQSAYFYRNAFGFDVIAYAGLETKTKYEAGYVLRQGNITFVLASPLGPEHPDALRIVLHGDGVQDIALEVDDVRAAYATATARGAVG